VAVSADGRRAVALTGAGAVQALPLVPPRQASPRTLQPSQPSQPSQPPIKPAAVAATPPPSVPKPFSWRVAGVPDSVALSPVAPVAVIGSWQDGGGVGVWPLKPGQGPRWLYREAEAGRAFNVHLSGDGKTVVAVSGIGPKRDRARAQVWNAETGKVLFRCDLDGFGAEARVSATGNVIAVSYSHVTRYNTGDLNERRLIAFNRAGERIFSDKGGLYFAPRLVCLSEDGARVTVLDGDRSLYTLDARGKFLSKLHFASDKAGNKSGGDVPTIKATEASENGAFLLVWRGDGMLTLLKAASS